MDGILKRSFSNNASTHQQDRGILLETEAKAKASSRFDKGGFKGGKGAMPPHKMPSQHNSENCTSCYMYVHKNGMS